MLRFRKTTVAEDAITTVETRVVSAAEEVLAVDSKAELHVVKAVSLPTEVLAVDFNHVKAVSLKVRHADQHHQDAKVRPKEHLADRKALAMRQEVVAREKANIC